VSAPDLTTLGALLKGGGSIKTGPFGTTLKAAEYSDSGVPVISVGEVGHGRLRVRDSTPRVGPGVVRRLPEYVLRAGDIVFGRKGAVDRAARVRESEDGYFLGSDGIRVRFAAGVDPRYMIHELQSAETRSWLIQNANGTTMASLNQEVLRRVPIRVLPLAEQRAVGQILDDVDTLVSSIERLIAKKQAIKQGMMQQLLTGRTRLSGFGAPWRTLQLPDLVSIKNGQVDPRRPEYRNLPLIAPDHVESATGRLLTVETAKAQGAISGKYLVGPGDVIYSKIRPYLQKAVRVDFSALCSADMYPLTPKPGIDGAFVLHTVLSEPFTRFTTSVSARSGIPKVNRAELAEFTLMAPDLLEQQAISAVLSQADTELFALEKLLAKRKAIKQGMMQELLTGRVRLPSWRS
jgi:type I restriction enzyme, S subunit